MTSTLRLVLRERSVGPVLAALSISAVGRWIYNVALPTYVYVDTRSAGWVAAVSAGRYLPALVATAGVAAAASRLGERATLVACDLTAAASSGVMTVLMMTHQGPAPVVVIAAVGSLATRTKLPIGIAYVAGQVTEAEIASVAAATRSTESVAMALGPAAGAALTVLWSSAIAVSVTSATFIVSAGITLSVRHGRPGLPLSADPWKEAYASWRRVLGQRTSLIFVALGAQASLLLGLDSVLFVILAQHRLHSGGAGYGLLFAGLGVGGLIGAALVDRFGSTDRPATLAAFALCACSLPTASFLFLHHTFAGVGVEVIRGCFAVLAEAVALTGLYRATDRTSLHQVSGVFAGVVLAGLVTGAAAAPVLLHEFGLDTTLIVASVAVPMLSLVLGGQLRLVDVQLRATSTADEQTIRLLRQVPALRGADRLGLERLAASSQQEVVGGGVDVVRQGDLADAFFVLTEGSVEVTETGPNGEPLLLRRLAAPASFGEIGVLHGRPRTATVTTSGRAVIMRMPAESFIAAITHEPALANAIAAEAARRLASVPESRTKPEELPRARA